MANIEFNLNPDSSFELHLLNADEHSFNRIKNILEDEKNFDMFQRDVLLELFLIKDIQIKEVNEYLEKNQPRYFELIEQKIQLSKEWINAGELDRYDMLQEFKEQAWDELDEAPIIYFDKYNFIEYKNENTDLNIKAILKYGLNNLKLYLSYHTDWYKIRKVDPEISMRKPFEELYNIGLALRGVEIPYLEILDCLLLRELNLILPKDMKPFKRINDVLKYIKTLDEDIIFNFLKNKIALRSYFKLKPLSEEFMNMDLKKLDQFIRHKKAIIELLEQTYYHSKDITNTHKEYVQYYSEFEIKISKKEGYKICNNSNKCKILDYHSDFKELPPFHVGCDCKVDYHTPDNDRFFIDPENIKITIS